MDELKKQLEEERLKNKALSDGWQLANGRNERLHWELSKCHEEKTRLEIENRQLANRLHARETQMQRIDQQAECLQVMLDDIPHAAAPGWTSLVAQLRAENQKLRQQLMDSSGRRELFLERLMVCVIDAGALKMENYALRRSLV